ncbi:hypothetical protein PV08_03846 [Exophiala spinifera]|uniref:Pentatricopeptide repeat domain-containing protein n=1 Tax=Exophiala spinifera TaxID=91928 RepID=A0A0D2BCF2_9EURO|nr:uncharacterized protein PV08_03846 [Exophiala spinifera]KIW16658.1 hypothetical protein PV08_03846 [Exophiala spinifera]
MPGKPLGSLIQCYRFRKPNSPSCPALVRQYLTGFPTSHGSKHENSSAQSSLTATSPPLIDPRTSRAVNFHPINAHVQNSLDPQPWRSQPRDDSRFGKRPLDEQGAGEPILWEPSIPSNEYTNTRRRSYFFKKINLDRPKKFENTWAKLYRRLVLPYDNDLERARERAEAHRQTALSFIRYDDVEKLRAAWLEMSRDSRRKMMPYIFIGSLVDSARKTLLMLTMLPALPRDWRMRCECLAYLDLVHREEIDAHPDLQALFSKQIERVSRVETWPKLARMPLAFLTLLLRHNTIRRCEDIVEGVFNQMDSVSVSTLLGMVDHYTRTGNADRAVELLFLIPVDQHQEFQQGILDRVAKIIPLDTIVETDGVRNFQWIPKLMQLGVPMNAKIHNLIIERAITLGRPTVAWELYRFMERENIDVDARRHLVLLRDGFERNERDKLDTIMSAIHERKDLFDDPYLVAYMMHIIRVICRAERKLPTESSINHVLAVYDRAYSRESLTRLGLVEAVQEIHVSDQQLLQPKPGLLAFTIWAITLCQTDERQVSRLWHWILHMIKQGDTLLLEAAKHDALYNGFIHFYCGHPSTLSNAFGVVQEMVNLGHCSPSQRTWSELLYGTLRYGQEDLAQHIWRDMLSDDMRLNKPAWEFLLARFEQSAFVRELQDEAAESDGVNIVPLSDKPQYKPGTGST